MGFPHSLYSIVVSGKESSSMVFTMSTNGTCATMAWNKSGLWLATDPTSRPPALPPLAMSLLWLVYPVSIRCSAAAMKSVNVLRLFNSFPSSYQSRPRLVPPRMWAIANINPLSNKLSLEELNSDSTFMPYDPYP